MNYDRITEAKFISRPNRFIAHIEIDGKEHIAHVKNTGRCKELLIPGATVFVQEFDSPHRKTKFDLISVYKGDKLINMDSQVPNKVFAEWVTEGNLIGKPELLKPEVKWENSRFDFYMEAKGRKIFAEVKGVTLEENGVAMFPDAPTLRGIKHLNELSGCISLGYEAYAVFIIQMSGVERFIPNDITHKAFGDALRAAKDAGVNIIALDCMVTETSITVKNFVDVRGL